MFNSIRGKVSHKGPEVIYILSNDIEWEIFMPVNDIQELPINEECRVFTWLYHREDQMRMFGFFNEKTMYQYGAGDALRNIEKRIFPACRRNARGRARRRRRNERVN